MCYNVLVNDNNTAQSAERVNIMTDTERVKKLLEEVKEIFNTTSDEEAKRVLKEIQYFQQIHFQL